MKFFKKIKQPLEKYVIKHPFRVVVMGILSLFSIYICSLIYHKNKITIFNIFSEPLDAPTHVINVLNMVGIIGSIVGFYYTHRQLKIANDRIVGYDDLFKWLETFFIEINNKHLKSFLFYGSTILPGNVSYQDEGPLKNYKDNLKKFLKITDDDSLDRQFAEDFSGYQLIKIIVPPDRKYTSNYDWFKEKRLVDLPISKDPSVWSDYVDSKKNKALDVQKMIQRKFSDIPSSHKDSFCINTPDKGGTYSIIKHAYFWFNGKRVIYVVPLHFTSGNENNAHRNTLSKVQKAQGGKSDTKGKPNKSISEDKREPINPEIIGFTTTNSNIIQAFREQFNRLQIANQ